MNEAYLAYTQVRKRAAHKKVSRSIKLGTLGAGSEESIYRHTEVLFSLHFSSQLGFTLFRNLSTLVLLPTT
jgi:hypothetical protein